MIFKNLIRSNVKKNFNKKSKLLTKQFLNVLHFLTEKQSFSVKNITNKNPAIRDVTTSKMAKTRKAYLQMHLMHTFSRIFRALDYEFK